MQSNVLPFFWNLASSSKDTRLGASADLVSSLEGFQQSFRETKVNGVNGHDEEDEEEDSDESDDGESGEEVDGDDEDDEDNVAGKALDKRLGAENAEDVVYSVKRLVRGLASSRESSRLGFSVALTEVLSRIQTITAPQVLSLIIRSCPHSKSMKGPEERDALFARLFGFTALIRSGCLFRTSTNVETVNQVIDHLLELGELKGWLRESAWWSLLALVEGLTECQKTLQDESIQHLVENVYGDKAWTQEKIALTQLLERLQPNLNWTSLLSPTFKHTPILSSPNLVNLGRVLKESDTSADDEEDVQASSTGSWKPQLHFVWDGIFNSYFGIAPAPRQASFQDFFRVVVDESLFSNTSSPERKYWGFLVLSRAITLVPSSQLSMLFTPNVMRSWINNLSSSDRYLHKAALNLAQQVQNFVKPNPSLGYTLLSALIQKGRMDFDKVTKTKTVETIMSNMNVDGVKDYVQYLSGVIVGTEKQSGPDENDIEQRRVWAIDQLYSLIRNGSVPKQDDWISDVLDLLLVNGFFVVRKANKKSDISAVHITPAPPFAESTAAACRGRFLQCIVEITTAATSNADTGPNDSAAAPRQQGSDSSGQLWITRALERLTLLQKDSKHLTMILDADEEIQSLRDHALATLSEIEKVGEGMEVEVIRGAQILLSFCILRTYDEAEDVLDMLEETNSAVRRLFALPSIEASSSSIEDTAPIDELLDVLVALLDKGSSDLRNMANLVFGMISSAFTPSSIQHLVAQLEQSTAEGIANELDDEKSEDDEDIDMASDEEVENGDDSDDDATSDSGDSVGDSEDDAEAVVDPEFRRRVAEALQVAGMLDDGSSQKRPRADEDLPSDGEDEDDDSEEGSSSEEELWDDDQMLKVDEQLAEVFRQRAGTARKGNLKNLHTESQHFKHRILDFFDVFARKQPSNPLILLTILPLLRLILNSSPTEVDLSNKAAGILRSRIGKAKHVPSPALTTMGIFEQVHQLARTAPTADFSSLCSICSIYIFRSISSASDSPSASRQEQAMGVYGETLKDYIQRKSSLVHPPFISDFIRRFPVASFPFFGQITDSVTSDKGVKVYRQVQAYGMVQVFSQQLALIGKSVSPEDLEKQLKAFATATLSLLSSVSEQAGDQAEGQGWNAQRLKDIVKTALHLCRTSKSALPPVTFGSIWNVEQLQELLTTLKAGDKTGGMKGVHGLVEQMIGVVRGSQKGSTEITKPMKKQVNGDVSSNPAKVVAEGEAKTKKRKVEEVKEVKKKRKSLEGKKVKPSSDA